MTREDSMDVGQVIGSVIQGLLAAAIGWFAASLRFQGRLDDFERRIVLPLKDRVSKFEGAASTFITREELKEALSEIKADVRQAVTELKSEIRELGRERRQ